MCIWDKNIKTSCTGPYAILDKKGLSRADPGEGGGPDHLKNHKNIGFLSNTGPDPL